MSLGSGLRNYGMLKHRGLGPAGGGVPNQAFTIVYDVYAGIVVCTMWNFQLVSPGF